MSKPCYEISKRTKEFLVLRDIGPWDKHMTITNAADEVVSDLIDQGLLNDGQKLLYYDTENNLDEIIIENKKFKGFKAFRDVEPGN